MAKVIVRGESYYIHDNFKKLWDRIKDGGLAKTDSDLVPVVDGRERVGKSLWAIQQAAYIDETILDDAPDGTLLPRITFSVTETLKAIRETKSTKEHTRVIIFDEAFRGLSSRSVLSRENKAIVSALQEMGQNNLVLFIVTPSFFLLELYPAVLRSSFLVHVKKNKKGRRMFKVYNYEKKGKLYKEGVRKGWNYNIYTRFKGFCSPAYPAGDEFEARYRKKKSLCLGRESFDKEKPEELNKFEKRFKIQRDNLLKVLRRDYFKTNTELASWCKQANIEITDEGIGKIVGMRPIKEVEPPLATQ